MKTIRKNYSSPLLSFDIYLDYFHKTIKELKSNNDIVAIKESIDSILTPQLETTIKEDPYDAIVVTDKSQTIVWVSEGFYDMTGYSSNYAIGKQPTFLQGKATEETTKKTIRKKIDIQNPFSGSIINYKKNGEEYLCELRLFPLRNADDEVTHYIALERRLEAA